MRVNTKVVLDIASGEVLSRESFEYGGPLAQALSFGGNKSKSQQQSAQQSTSASGTRFNENFLSKALEFATAGPGKRKINIAGDESDFDPGRYLAENPDVVGYGGKRFVSPEAAAWGHWTEMGRSEGRKFPGEGGVDRETEIDLPTYAPEFKRTTFTPGAFTGSNFTAVAPEGFKRLEDTLFEGQQAKLSQAYNQQLGRQREELSQTGALTSPAQYLEGGARSSLDRSFMENLQQAARDAFTGRLGLEEREAGRRTGYDVGEATRRTGFDVGEAERVTGYGEREAGRETGFNEQTQARLLEAFFKKLQAAIESGRYGTQQSTGASSGGSSEYGGRFGFFSG